MASPLKYRPYLKLISFSRYVFTLGGKTAYCKSQTLKNNAKTIKLLIHGIFQLTTRPSQDTDDELLNSLGGCDIYIFWFGIK